MVNWSENKLLKGLGLYQLFSGIPGIVMLMWRVFFSTRFSPDSWSVFYIFMMLLLNLTLIASGYFLILNKIKWGKRLSFFTQSLQLIAFSIGGFTYLFVSGTNLLINIDLTRGFRIGFDFSLISSRFSLAFGAGNSEAALISINIIPIIFIYLLEKALKNKSTTNAY
jgi:hypothetical protein